MSETYDPVARKIEAWRDALIDLTRRNPLLSLPRAVVPVRAAPDDLWKLPPTGKRGAYTFLRETLAADAPAKRRQPANDEEMKRLDNLRQKARLSLTEQGINILFVALGTLQWEDPRLGTLRSPLLLLPVDLARLPDRSGFTLSRLEDDAAVNPTLAYRLKQADVDVALPEPEEEDIIPSAFLQQLETLVQGKRGWSVDAGECLLGRFSFLGLAMYDDLAKQSSNARRHPIVAALAGEAQALRGLPAVDVPPETELDGQSPQSGFDVLPADPSQEQAILAARRGQSFVLQGPPGTGKTQTIANLIAHCIADGRRVLFVSEKMAALEAVYKRLQERGLGDFCLEAHSHKANKKDILAQLRRARDARHRQGVREPAFDVLAGLRARLDAHVRALHAPRAPLGISVYEARGQAASLAGAPDLPFVFTAPETLTPDDLHRCEALAERLAGYHDLFPRVDIHPWRTLRDAPFTAELQARVKSALDELLLCADRTPSTVAELRARCGLPEIADEDLAPEHVVPTLALARLLEETPRPARRWLESGAVDVERLREEAGERSRRYHDYRRRRQALLARWTDELFALPHADLAARVAERHEAALRPALGPAWADAEPDAYGRVEAALERLATASDELRGSALRLGELCGLPAPETSAAARFAAQVCQVALTDPKPRVGWFAPGALATLVTRAREAEEKHAQHDAARSAVGDAYTDAIYALDLDALGARFAGEYAGFLRWLKPPFYRDRGVVRTALQPGGSLSGRDLDADLARARQARDTGAWIQQNAPGLAEVLGVHYRGSATDWPVLHRALADTEALVQLLRGSVPAPLQERLVGSGPLLDELRDQHALCLRRGESFDAALKEALALVQLPDAATVPVAQLPLARIAAWCRDARERIADVHAARTQAQPACIAWPLAGAALAADLREAEALVAESAAVAAEAAGLKERYADFFAGLETDWERVLIALDWTARLLRALSERGDPLSPAIAEIAVDGDRQALDGLRRLREGLERDAANAERIGRDADALFRPEMLRTRDGALPLLAGRYAEQRDFCEERLAAISEMERWLGFQALRLECADRGMLSFFEVTTRRQPPAAAVLPAFRKGFYERWLDGIVAGVPELHSLRGDAIEQERRKFGELDTGLIALNPRRVAAAARERRANLDGELGEAGTLQRLLQQQRPRASVRRIFSEIPNVLFRLTPCLLMSPLSVSLFLDPERLHFDLVVFDEASQIFVQSALGPLLRAKQAVIAGDTKQLPPTSFFRGMTDDGGSDEDGDGIATAATDAREFESILAAASAISRISPLRFCERTLTWHYRSRHESLIAFSRGAFYTELNTFPSARRSSALRFEFVADGVYHGGEGKSRTNPREAARVADLVVAQLLAEPQLTVGVIAMSEAQQGAIQRELDARAAADPNVAALLAEDPTPERPEPVFVKNIENVQGDERDVIFLSVGYGKYPDGTMYQRFGPINSEGGERRLNVAVTRARHRCITVASIAPEDIVIGEGTHWGPRRLRAYLEAARAAQQVTADAAPLEDADLLADSVALALERRGHAVRRGVGLFDYRVDVAVVDPADKDRFLLGIECDGAVYADGATARAREYLRADVLKGLGWRLERVWSADWVRDREGVLAVLDAAIQRAALGEPEPPAAVTYAPPHERVERPPAQVAEERAAYEVAAPEPERRSCPDLLPGLTYFEPAPPRTLDGGTAELYSDDGASVRSREGLVEHVVLAEGPLPLERVAAHLTRAAGLQRTGPRIQEIARRTIDGMVGKGLVQLRPEGETPFVWPPPPATAPARVPRPGTEPRPLEHVSRAEIGQVILAMLRSAIGMRREEAIVEAARLLGYDRTGAVARQRIEAALDELEMDREIHVRGGQIYTFEEHA